MRKLTVLIMIAMLTVTVSGCFTMSTGNPAIIDSTKLAVVKEGVSTKADVRTAFGEPQNISFTQDSETWNYTYSPSRFMTPFTSPELRINHLTVFFNNKGTVQKFGTSGMDVK